MTSFLARLFGRRSGAAAAPAKAGLDISALKGVMSQEAFDTLSARRQSSETTSAPKESPRMAQTEEISPKELAELMKTTAVKLIDVRTPEEFSIARIEGAVLVDQALAQEIVETWPKDTPIVTMCHHGRRSLDALAYLRGQGFSNVKSMAGGIERWSLEVDSSVPRY